MYAQNAVLEAYTTYKNTAHYNEVGIILS